jgi:Zn-dependent protease with chaperone function
MPMWTLRGQWQDGVSTQQQELTLQVDEAGRVIGPDGLIAPCHFTELKVSDRLGNTPRFLQFPGGARLTSSDHDTIDTLCRRFQRRRTALAYRLEKRLSIALLSLLLVIGAGVAAVQYGMPWLAKRVAFWLPAETSAQLGKGTLKTLDTVAFSPSQLPVQRQQALQLLFHRLEPADLPGLQLNLRHGGRIGANAFALPDGSIVMTDELVELSRSDAELSGVLAHEMGHVNGRHALRHTLQSSGTALIMLALLGDVSTVTSLAAGVPTMLLELKYSRQFEWEADAYAARLMQAKGLPLSAFGDLLDRLDRSHHQQNDTSEPAFLSTHPVTAERIRRFREHLDETP